MLQLVITTALLLVVFTAGFYFGVKLANDERVQKVADFIAFWRKK
jgi:hypothetical protein